MGWTEGWEVGSVSALKLTRFGENSKVLMGLSLSLKQATHLLNSSNKKKSRFLRATSFVRKLLGYVYKIAFLKLRLPAIVTPNIFSSNL